MNVFLKLVGLPRNRSGSFGIDTKTVPTKFGGPTTSTTYTRPMVPFLYQQVSELPRFLNHMRQILRHRFQSVDVLAES